MGAPTGMAPPRTVTQGWLGLFAISPIHYASNRAVATPQLLGKATTLGCQKLRVFRPCGVSRSYKIDTIAYIEGCLRGYCGLRTKVFDHRLHFLSAVEHNYFPCLRVRSGDSPISSRNAPVNRGNSYARQQKENANGGQRPSCVTHNIHVNTPRC